MSKLHRFSFLLQLSRYHSIGRRYFVVNGFDGALTMLGILLGFYQADDAPVPLVISACLGAAVALGISGISSAYISEAAERQRELKELESAMATSLDESAHAQAAKLTPAIIALINGLAPFLLSLLILTPLWVANSGIELGISPLEAAMLISVVEIFFLGVFLGKVSGEFWLWSGIRTLLIAIITGSIILFLVPN